MTEPRTLYTFAYTSAVVAVNPFTPGWGTAPRVLIGRDALLDQYRRAFGPDAAADVHRRSHLAAPRASGKTVLLDAIEDVAGEQGWHSISVDAGTKTSPLGERIIRELRKLDQQLDPPGRRINAVQASVIGIGGSVGWDNPGDDLHWGDLRSALEHVTNRTNGLLITVDEVHEATRDEIHELGNALQHLARQGAPLAVVMAGLPANAERRTHLRSAQLQAAVRACSSTPTPSATASNRPPASKDGGSNVTPSPAPFTTPPESRT